MSAAFVAVTDVVGAAGRSWEVFEARLQILDAQLGQTDRLAASLGAEHRGELERLKTRLSQLGAAVAGDPLAVAATDIDAFEVSLRSVGRDIAALVAWRDGLTARVTEARDLLEELRRVAAAGADAHRVTVEKIAGPGVPDPLPVPPDLERELERAATSGARGDWRTVSRLLADWTSRATASLTEARRVLDANRAPMATRNELRGRLDAYRAKAFGLGLLENHIVAGLYERAHDALYSAPTDLADAASLVGQYQEAIAELGRRGVSREM